MSWLPLPYIQLESARTNGTDYFDTQWNAGYGFSVQFVGCAFTDGGYLLGAMSSENSDDKFALQFRGGKYVWYFGDKTAESSQTYELGEPHYFSFSSSGSWSIDGVSMPSVSFSLSQSNQMTLSVYVGAVNVGGEAQHIFDTQIGYINFNGSSGTKDWRQCRYGNGAQRGFCLYNSNSISEFVEKQDFTYGGVMVTQSGTPFSVIGIPTKTAYKLGEPFDPTGMTAYLNLDDATRRDITSEIEAKYPDGSVEFRSDAIIKNGYINYIYYKYKPVGVDYTGFAFGSKNYYASLSNVTYSVSSDSPVESIEVTRLPDKTEYLIKDYINLSGMIVTGHLANGETAEIGDSTSWSGVTSPFMEAGTFAVTISWYNGAKTLYTNFHITVKNGLEKLNITLPTKSEYSIGEKFNPTGITVTALYLDGTERPIYNFFVDSSKFDSTKEGGYAITVKATVDEKEYTETITVYVFGAPKKLEDLLGTTEGMTVIRNNSKNDGGKDTISGVDWFVFDGNTASKIYVSGDNFISFNGTTEHIKICRRDGATYYVYSQAGKLDNGHKFMKIRVEGYTYWSSATAQYALKYELFLFDDNSMYLNILQAPTNTSYLGTSELLYGTTHTAFTVEAGKAQEFSFYTSDAAQGKPWWVVGSDRKKLEDLMDTTDGMTVLVENTQTERFNIEGVSWFAYDEKQADTIVLSSGGFGFGGSYGHLYVCTNGTISRFNYLYRQEGALENGHRFLKIRFEGYTNYQRADSRIKYELFLFDDEGMLLNLVEVPSDPSYLYESRLRWTGETIPLTIAAGKPQKISFYTTDPAHGKPWLVAYYDYDFEKKSVQYLTATPTKREYNVGDELDSKAFDVTAKWLDGKTEKITDFTVDSANFDNQNEGRYIVTVKAEIGGREYTAETLVVVYGEPHNLSTLIDTENYGLKQEALYFFDSANIYGVPWFNFDGKTIDSIRIAEGCRLYFSDSEKINFTVYDYTGFREREFGIQEGKLENGHRFFKIRASKAPAFELFFFDDNSMFFNLVEPYSTDSRIICYLQWGDEKIDLPAKKSQPLKASFYTTDTKLGKPWTVEYEYHKFVKQPESISAVATKREYNVGDYLNRNSFGITATFSDGTTANIKDFTIDASSFNRQKEGRYIIPLKTTILGTEYTANATVVVYGEPYDILDLLNTKDGMENIPEISAAYNNFGDVSWFVFDEKPVFEFSLLSRNHIYINGKSALDVCANPSGTSNDAYIQEGRLSNGHKFFKLRAEALIPRMFPCYELFLFDDNSIYLNLISTQTEESNLGESKLIWSDGKIEMPVEFGQPQKFSFYTENPSEGKPWTMEVDYHNFIKEKMRTLTVEGGEGSGLYLPGESVTIKAEEKTGNRFRWVKDGEIFVPKEKLASTYIGSSPSRFKNGNLLVFAYDTTTESPASINGWEYDGTLVESGDKDAGNTQNIGYVHVYHKICDGTDSTYRSGIFVEVENASSIEIQEDTRVENVPKSTKFLCKKITDDICLWFFNCRFGSSSTKWIAEPDIVTYVPAVGSSDTKLFSILVDENVPAKEFYVQENSASTAYYASSFGARIVPSCTGYEYEMTFTMPDEDLKVTAEYSPKLGRIEITEQPFKLNYGLNERFDRSGMVVTAHYADGTSTTVTNYSVSDLDSSTVGAKEVTVTYTDGIDTATATLTVNVGISGIAITKFPDKTAYAISDDFDPAGLEVSFVFGDNSTVPTEDYTLSGFSAHEVGIKNITVTCEVNGETYTAQFSVFVTANGDNPFAGYNENRTLRIHFLNGKYADVTGDEIESESMSLTESLGNDKNFRFGGCISTQFSVNIFSEQFLDPDVFPEGDIEVYLEVGEESLKIFTGTIESAERTGGLNKRKIVAYDFLKRKGTIKLKNWYKSLTFPMHLNEFRNSLFEYVGIEQVEQSVGYDYCRVPDNMNVDSLTFLSLIKDICVAASCFGHINADGKFEYIQLRKNGKIDRDNPDKFLYYPPEDVIPDEEVINATFKEGTIWHPKWFWITPDPENPNKGDFEPSDVEAYEGNIYFIRNNYVIGDSDWIKRAYFLRTTTFDDIIQDDYLLKYVIVFGPKSVEDDNALLYLAREYSLTTPGNFLRRIGTNIEFHCIKYLEDGTPVTWTINSYIMSRTITGIRSLRDVYTAKNSAYNEEAYGAAKDLRDVTDAVTAIKEIMPKSTATDEENPEIETVEPFGGVKAPKTKTEKEKEEAKKKEEPNTLYVYPDGEARYNGTSISGSGGGGFNVVSVESLPENPDLNNTIYLIQGEVVVE